MIELLFTACLSSTLSDCKPVSLYYLSETPPSQFECLMIGQLEMAKWKEGNPSWTITKWACKYHKQQAEKEERGA